MVSLEDLRAAIGPSADGWSEEDLARVRGFLELLALDALESVEATEESPAA